jgi:hypothetical protein
MGCNKIKKPPEKAVSAEAGGFEPPVRLLVRQFSKLLVSATHPNFRMKSLQNCLQIYEFVFSLSKEIQIFRENIPTFAYFFVVKIG